MIYQRNFAIEGNSNWPKEPVPSLLSFSNQKTTQVVKESIGISLSLSRSSSIKKIYLNNIARIEQELKTAQDCENPNQVCFFLSSEIKNLEQQDFLKLEKCFESLLMWSIANFYPQVIASLLVYESFFSSNLLGKFDKALVDSCYIQNKYCVLEILKSDQINPSFNGNEALLAALANKSFSIIFFILNHKKFDATCNTISLIYALMYTAKIHENEKENKDKICLQLLEKILKKLDLLNKSLEIKEPNLFNRCLEIVGKIETKELMQKCMLKLRNRFTSDLEDDNKPINTCSSDYNSDPDKDTQLELET